MNHSESTQANVSIAASSVPGGTLTGFPLFVRVSPHNYFAALLLSTFLSAFLFYLEIDLAGTILFVTGWILIPTLALNDKIAFDGKRIYRTGIIPGLWGLLASRRRRLRISDIEQVETQAIRTLKRGGNVYYRYRTSIRGKGIFITIASGGENFRKIIIEILSRLPENVLDNRSIEIRDHLAEPKNVLHRVDLERIPSADLLEKSFAEMRIKERHADSSFQISSAEDRQHIDGLRVLANELRIMGRLSQSLEVFRRAFRFRPVDARLFFECSRCLHSFAGTRQDDLYERKALALMRLAERRAAADDELLARIGESYFQIGEWKRAAKVFQKVLDRGNSNFRSARGLAELALREGKIAHVIHHFSTANRIASIPALRRWAKIEADYFSHLNSDDEYMEMEVGRVSLLEKLETGKKSVLRVGFVGLPVILTGVVLEDFMIANVGWAVSMISFILWGIMLIAENFLSGRIPFDLIDSNDFR